MKKFIERFQKIGLTAKNLLNHSHHDTGAHLHHVNYDLADSLQDLSLKEQTSIKKLFKIVFVLLLGVTGLKYYAYALTESLTLKAAFIDTVKDDFLSLLNLLVLKLSSRPASAKYPCGYGKLESFFALIQSAILIAMGIDLLHGGFTTGHIHQHYATITNVKAIIALLISLGLITALALIQAHFARLLHSSILKADSTHYKADIFTNLAIVACFLTSYRFAWIDMIAGIGIALFCIIVAFQIGKDSLAVLLDRSLPQEKIDLITHKISSLSAGKPFSVTAINLGHREMIFIDFSNADLPSVNQSLVKKQIKDIFPKALVTFSENQFSRQNQA